MQIAFLHTAIINKIVYVYVNLLIQTNKKQKKSSKTESTIKINDLCGFAMFKRILNVNLQVSLMILHKMLRGFTQISYNFAKVKKIKKIEPKYVPKY